jgi:putative transcriptional regulator
MSKLGTRLIDGLNEAIAIARKDPAALRTIPYERADVAAIRKELKLSQEKFAARFRLSAATVRDWEQGRRMPDASANNYLLVIKYAPKAVEKALAKAREDLHA